MEEKENKDIFKETVLSGELIREFDALDRAERLKETSATDREAKGNEDLDFSEDDLDLMLEAELRDQPMKSSARSDSIGTFLSRVGHRIPVQQSAINPTEELGVNQFLHGMFSRPVPERTAQASVNRRVDPETPSTDVGLDPESIGAYLLKTLEPAV